MTRVHLPTALAVLREQVPAGADPVEGRCWYAAQEIEELLGD